MRGSTHSWFPAECCGGNDCKEVVKWEEHGEYHWKITNADGTFVVERKFEVQPSQDDKRYMCIYNAKVYCLFANLEM